MKKLPEWTAPTAAGVIGLGIGYWFGKKRTVAPAGQPISYGWWVGQPADPNFLNQRNLYAGNLVDVAQAFFHAIYPPQFHVNPCRDWLTTPLARQRAYVSNVVAQRGASLGGYTVDNVVYTISNICRGTRAATPVPQRSPYQFVPFTTSSLQNYGGAPPYVTPTPPKLPSTPYEWTIQG